MSAERELEQLRQSFAVERSQLENALAEAKQYENDREELNAALEMIAELRAEVAKLRKQLDEACNGEKELDGPVHVALPPVERFERRLGDYCPSPVEPRAEKPKRNLSTEESREFWRKAEEAAEEINTWPDWKRAGINTVQIRSEPRVAVTARCEACGTPKPEADDECSWCGPGAHKP